MELPVVHRLQKRFPENDIYVIKHGPSGRNLHHDWNPGREGGHYARWLDSCRKALAQLGARRGEAIVAEMTSADGVDAKRVVLGKARPASAASDKAVTLALELEVAQ